MPNLLLVFEPCLLAWRQATRAASRYRYRAIMRAKRLSRAWQYATGRLTADNAQRVIGDCEPYAGWYPLLVLSVEDTLDEARDVFHHHPELRAFIDEGCSCVARKWESYNDELFEARRWAIELAEGYAASDGIILVKRDDEIEQPTDTDDHVPSDGGRP